MCHSGSGDREGGGGHWLWLCHYFSRNGPLLLLAGLLVGTTTNVRIFEGYRLCKVHGASGIELKLGTFYYFSN